MNNALLHWKSTVSGILTLLMAITGPFLVAPADMLASSGVSHRTILIAFIIQSAGKVLISAMQQDAGKTVATLPGSPEPKIVPSHEIPDNPAATPVKE